MTRIFVRLLMALFAALYLFVHFAPRAHAHDHDGIDQSGAGMSEITLLGAIEITRAFVRATLPNAPVGGGYMTITNTGSEDDRLLGAASALAQQVELHEMAMEGEVMRMRALSDGIALPAGETVTLAPGGLHVMYLGINQPFVPGECVETLLRFEKAGEVAICLAVEGIAADGPAAHHDH